MQFIFKYRKRIAKDLIVAIILFGIMFVLYTRVMHHLPIHFVFNSIFQNIRSTFVAEYTKVYYPIYYFSEQLNTISGVFDDNDTYNEVNEKLIDNFIAEHDFVENMSISSERFAYSFQKSSGVSDYVSFKNISTNQIIVDRMFSIEHSYMLGDDIYTKIVFSSHNNMSFIFDIKFSTKDVLGANNYPMDGIYAYIVSRDNVLIMPIENTTEDEIPAEYKNIVLSVENKNIASDIKDNELFRIRNDRLYYWVYRNNFEIEGDIANVGIIASEATLVNKVRLPVSILFISIILMCLSIIIFFSIRYIRILDIFNKEYNNLDILIQNGETDSLEFKSTLCYDMKTKIMNKSLETVIMKSIAAFSNGNGGRLLIGVADSGEILGLENDYSTLKQYGRDFFELHLRSLIVSNYGNIFSADNIKIEFLCKDEKEICSINIKKGREPIYTKSVNKHGVSEEKFYVRVGNSSRGLSSMSEAIEYIKNRFK